MSITINMSQFEHLDRLSVDLLKRYLNRTISGYKSTMKNIESVKEWDGILSDDPNVKKEYSEIKVKEIIRWRLYG